MKWFLNKITGIAILNFLILLFAVALIPLQNRQSVAEVKSVSGVLNNIEAVTLTPVPTRDLFAELKSHNAKGDCWMSYKGNIYDITPVFGTHPGGDEVMLKYCGNDASAGFDAVPHSANAMSLLAQYLIQ